MSKAGGRAALRLAAGRCVHPPCAGRIESSKRVGELEQQVRHLLLVIQNWERQCKQAQYELAKVKPAETMPLEVQRVTVVDEQSAMVATLQRQRDETASRFMQRVWAQTPHGTGYRLIVDAVGK